MTFDDQYQKDLKREIIFQNHHNANNALLSTWPMLPLSLCILNIFNSKSSRHLHQISKYESWNITKDTKQHCSYAEKRWPKFFFLSANTHTRFSVYKIAYIRDCPSGNPRIQLNLLILSRSDLLRGRDNSYLLSEIFECFPGIYERRKIGQCSYVFKCHAIVVA